MGHSKAAIIIGNYDYHYEVYNEEWDVYYFPENITEWELIEEISNLVKFYNVLDYPIYWPPHLRKKIILQKVEGEMMR